MPCENASTAGSTTNGTGGLKDMIAEDAINVFCNTSDFAETIVYYPRNGGARQIDAVVIRQQLEQVSETGNQSVLPVFSVHVANDLLLGVSSTELNLGNDQFALSVRDGQTPAKKTILRILYQDNGMLVLECR